jgi:hypothetical protein
MADDSNIRLVSMLVVAAPSAIASWIIEPRRRKKAPTTRRYTWGIYISLMQTIVGGAFALLALFDDTLIGAFLYGVLGAGIFACGVGGYKRRKWGFIACGFLSLNPITWIANYRYGRNRWSEFEAEALARNEDPGATLLS